MKDLFKRNFLQSVLTAFFAVVVVGGAVNAATTISTNINTGGTLTVSGVMHASSTALITGAVTTYNAATFNENSSAVDFRIESDTDTHAFYLDGTNSVTGNASSTPWGQFGFEAVQGVAGANRPIFVIGDQGTTSALFQIGAKNGNALFASNAVFNEDGLDEDFRIEGDTQTNVFYLDASADSAGIASTTPWGQFSVEAVQGIVGSGRPIFVVGDQGTTSALFQIGAKNGNALFASNAVFNEDGLDEDFRIEGDTQTNVFYLDASADSAGIASTTPWGQFSVEAVQGIAGVNRPIFVVADQGTTSPEIIVNALGNVGFGTSTPGQEIGVEGDALLSSSATTTLVITSTTALTGGCIQIRGTDGNLYRMYATSTAPAQWQAGSCQSQQ